MLQGLLKLISMRPCALAAAKRNPSLIEISLTRNNSFVFLSKEGSVTARGPCSNLGLFESIALFQSTRATPAVPRAMYACLPSDSISHPIPSSTIPFPVFIRTDARRLLSLGS